MSDRDDDVHAEATERVSEPSRSRWAHPVVRVIALAAAAAVAILLLRPSGGEADLPLPAFDLPELIGDGSISDADLKGQPLVINFWASWCEPCRTEAPMLDRMANEYAPDGLAVLGVDVQDVPLAAQEFVREFDLTYLMVEDRSQTLYTALREATGSREGLPQTYFVSASGLVSMSGPAAPVLGELEEAELRAAIEALID